MATGGTNKRWNGSTFKVGGTLKRWDGSTFKTGGTLRRWNGYEFVPDPSPGTIALSNTAEGGSDGTLITTASQTGSGSGDAFSSISNTSSISFSSTQALAGSLSYKFAQVASATCGMTWNVTANSESYMRAYFYLTSYATSSHVLFDITNTGTQLARITLSGTGTTAGQLRVLNAGTQIATTSTVLALNTWYRLELHTKINTTSGMIEIRAYNGKTHDVVVSISQTGLNTGSSQINQVKVGSNTSMNSPTVPPVYIDNIAYGTGGWLGA